MGYSAADIERYTYCPLSWWLSRAGVDGTDEALREGVKRHEEKGKGLSAWQRTIRDHKESLQTALYLGLVASAAATLAIEVTFLDWSGVTNRVLMLMSLLWLLVSLAFLAHALRKEDEAREVQARENIVHGEDVTYSDLNEGAVVLRSEKYELGGKPDYIVERQGMLIPVEVKTGKTPPVPHESHVLQLGTYCMLVEECLGKRPPHGVISYEGRNFEIPYTEDLKDQVLETVLRMRLAELTGKVHRDHQRYGKCMNCSRRAACPERLQPAVPVHAR